MRVIMAVQRTGWAVWVALTLSGLGPGAYADEPCAPTVGRFASVEGTVEVQRAEGEAWRSATLEQGLCQGDTIRVGELSRAAVALANDAVLRLDQNTTMRLLEVAKEPEKRSLLEILKGAFQSFSRKPRLLSIHTPYLNGLIEGTEFLVRVEADRASLGVLEGRVAVENAHGQTKVAPGELATAQAGKAPVLQTVVRPRDAVQWALYYPPVLSVSGKAAEQVPPSLQKALEAARRGDTAAAFGALDRVPASEQDPRFHLYRAALLLSVGRVDEARPDIDRALARDPKASLGYALRSVIGVVQNERDQALAGGQRAVELAPDSAAARIALSYAQQARFQLEQARDTLRQAVEKEPENALAWARLAELHSSFGELDDAQEAAQKAVALDPELSRTQTVLGFAYLMQVNTTQSKEAFEKAIAQDQADPLPRLGLGLAKIREGDLQEGRQEIEIATGLDPNNSLVRSYLGKAYYEEKRTDLTDPQYAIAKELDPNDPTPYFYDAIEKQTTNRPVEALHDIQKAIELNDNRAVYRSKLLLDSDLAARSASLARVYTDLGFQQLALVEGWKSVNTDPSNYSAHRFLADSYSVQPRHEIARVSELLQSQLLQPINTTPIQPRLAESNLFLISSGGPGGLSFNEFNPLFSRNGFTFQTSGLVGENDTYAGEGVVSGIYNKTSFSAGGFHFTTDGFRQNADQEDDVANAFVQQELGPNTSIQAEYRFRNTEKGDLPLRFFPEDFRPKERQTLETDTYRLGLRHAFSPASVALGSFVYQDLEDSLSDEPPFPPINSIDIRGDQEAVSGEVQHLYRSRYFNVTSGAGHFDISGEDQFTTELAFGPEIVQDVQLLDRDLNHTSAYVYSYLNFLRNVTFTAGASIDFLRGESAVEEKDQFNPKFGITWSPFSATTLRAAVFRVLKRPLITDQTLEPTQVAGFNQFFDDGNGTESWRYGGAIDQKFSTALFGGLEFSQRDLSVPFLFADPPNPIVAQEADWTEQLGRAYLFWTPHNWLALRTEYVYERFERDREFTFGVREVDTHRVPVGISFFHPSGVSASVTATYVNQDGEFEPNPEEFRSGNDDFWVVNAAIGYRLPKRYGFVTLGVTNLFDKEFQFQDPDFESPSFQPDRVAFGRITLQFP